MWYGIFGRTQVLPVHSLACTWPMLLDSGLSNATGHTGLNLWHQALSDSGLSIVYWSWTYAGAIILSYRSVLMATLSYGPYVSCVSWASSRNALNGAPDDSLHFHPLNSNEDDVCYSYFHIYNTITQKTLWLRPHDGKQWGGNPGIPPMKL